MNNELILEKIKEHLKEVGIHYENVKDSIKVERDSIYRKRIAAVFYNVKRITGTNK